MRNKYCGDCKYFWLEEYEIITHSKKGNKVKIGRQSICDWRGLYKKLYSLDPCKNFENANP